ncbi:MAG: LEPR-XLL domain-containing protein, partial [Burkholderiales bacterium]
MNAPFEKKLWARRKPERKPVASPPPFRRKLLFEVMEQRLLLSADAASPAVADLLVVDKQEQQPQPILQEHLVALTADFSDVATDELLPDELGPESGFILLDKELVSEQVEGVTWLGQGADLFLTDQGELALVADGATDNEWRITGPDSGTLNGQPFSGVGILIGGADNEDTFHLEANGNLSGYLHGGDRGFDSLVIDGGSYGESHFLATGPDSGIIQLDDKVISYFGLEPVDDTSDAPEKSVEGTAGTDVITIDGGPGVEDPITVNSDGTFENHNVTQPDQLLTVEAGDGDDTINFDLLFHNAALLIDGGDGNDTLDLSGRAVPMSAIGLSDGSYILTDGSSPRIELRNIETIVGAEYTIQANGVPNWVEQGPGSVNVNPDRPTFRGLPWSGAVEAIAPHPDNADIIYVGTVNGGVWRTTDGGSTWQPLTDQFPSLAIGALTISTHDNAGDPVTGATPYGDLVLYAGTGQFSNHYDGGQSVGVYRSTDGGDTWSLVSSTEMLGLPVSSIVATRVDGQDIVVVGTIANVETTRVGDEYQRSVVSAGGIFRSVDGGATFARNELVAAPTEPGGYLYPASSVTDVVQDPGNLERMYAGVIGGGVYQSDNAGETWTPINTGLTLAGDGYDNDAIGGIDNATENVTGAARIVLAVRQDPLAADNPVYAGLIGKTNWLLGVFQKAPADGSWSLVGSDAAPRRPAESVDVVMSGNPNLTFNPGATPTITRLDTGTGGSFVDDGFVANRYIAVRGSSSNNWDFYVTNVTAGTLTLEAGSNLNAVAAPGENGIRLTQISQTLLRMEGNTNVRIADPVHGANTIFREAGDFLRDGFMVGHR